jgi:hypothetical protein
MAVSEKLNENFVNEFFKLAIRNKRVFEVIAHHLKYQFLPNEHYKEIWKIMQKYYNVSGQLPTIGWIGQELGYNSNVVSVLSEIKDAQIIDKDEAMNQFEVFLKNAMFLEAYDELGDLFVKGDREQVFKSVNKLNENLSSFVIRDTYYDKIFEGVLNRHSERLSKQDVKTKSVKIPFGIDALDDISRGGVDKGDVCLFLAGSGVGKSKVLKHIGINGARRGFKMLHIQAEGTRQETLDAYDAGVTGVRLHNLEVGNIDTKTLNEIERASSNITLGGGEVFVEAFEKFDTASLQDVRDIIVDIIRTHGEIDGLILDYMELFDPGDGKRYSVDNERQRREAVANKLKNIAVEFNIAVFSASQSVVLSKNLLNDPDFVMTRYHISEMKGVIKPMSYFITMNQTDDEKENNHMRLYLDKCRKYASSQTIPIFNNYDHERFYDRKRTLNEIYTPPKKTK